MFPKATVVAFLAFVVLLLAAAAPDAVATTFPDRIQLPDGFQPEGVVTGHGPTIYAGSLANGAIYQASLRTGEGEILIPGQDGVVAVGLGYDARANTLYVSGGPTGLARIYDASNGDLVAEYQLGTPGATFINDVIVTRAAAYFTDSFASVYYRVPLGAGGASMPAAAVETIAFSDNYPFNPGGFNSNGIVATPDGRWLIVANSSAQAIYRVEPETGAAVPIDLGGADLPNADGLVLLGHTLYIVQNQINQIAVVQLAPDFLSGSIAGTITDEGFRVPTTAAAFGNAVYVVNARFGTPPGPDVDYDIIRVRR